MTFSSGNQYFKIPTKILKLVPVCRNSLCILSRKHSSVGTHSVQWAQQPGGYWTGHVTSGCSAGPWPLKPLSWLVQPLLYFHWKDSSLPNDWVILQPCNALCDLPLSGAPSYGISQVFCCCKGKQANALPNQNWNHFKPKYWYLTYLVRKHELPACVLLLSLLFLPPLLKGRFLGIVFYSPFSSFDIYVT